MSPSTLNSDTLFFEECFSPKEHCNAVRAPFNIPLCFVYRTRTSAFTPIFHSKTSAFPLLSL